jgi:hypothetical protein
VGLDAPYPLRFNFGCHVGGAGGGAGARRAPEPFAFDVRGFNAALLAGVGALPSAPKLPPAAARDVARAAAAHVLPHSGITLAPPPPPALRQGLRGGRAAGAGAAPHAASAAPLLLASEAPHAGQGARAGPELLALRFAWHARKLRLCLRETARASLPRAESLTDSAADSAADSGVDSAADSARAAHAASSPQPPTPCDWTLHASDPRAGPAPPPLWLAWQLALHSEEELLEQEEEEEEEGGEEEEVREGERGRQVARALEEAQDSAQLEWDAFESEPLGSP